MADLEDEVRWHAQHSMGVWLQRGTAARTKPSMGQAGHAPAPEKASLNTDANMTSQVGQLPLLLADCAIRRIFGGESILFKLRAVQLPKS